MNIPAQTKPAIWGAIGGALACAVIGFSWGGWVTGSTASKEAAVSAQDARVAALAPICAARFRAQVDATEKVAQLAAASYWERADVVEKSGAAMMPGSKEVDDDVARACAQILMKPSSTNET